MRLKTRRLTEIIRLKFVVILIVTLLLKPVVSKYIGIVAALFTAYLFLILNEHANSLRFRASPFWLRVDIHLFATVNRLI